MDRSSFNAAASRFLAAFRDLLYPPRCVGCGKFGGRFLCEECIAGLRRPEGDGFCNRCDSPLDGETCSACPGWDALSGCRAAFLHEGAARAAVHGLKYQRVRALAPDMAESLKPLVDSLVPDTVFAIPLHPTRQRRRGYNQSATLIDKMGRRAQPGLLRQRRTRSQVGLDAAARRENVRGAFEYRGQPLTGKRVVLIDDVVTSGATANECARVLRQHGATRVHVVAFARAHPNRAHSDA